MLLKWYHNLQRDVQLTVNSQWLGQDKTDYNSLEQMESNCKVEK